MLGNTLYWHDYETFGLDPKRDRPAQFAGVRTDLELNVIDDPLVVYCKPPADYLPDPEACMVTGITPQLAAENGVCEAAFIAQIHQQMAQPGTCATGYNSIRFDDEVTRNTLYRNFFDPYIREWKNGNSRWDIIDLTRAMRALRPEGIEWPVNEEGRSSFRLEELTAANGLEHSSAHDALSDVYATIEFARLIKRIQPRLYTFVFEHRSKATVNELLKLGSMTPILHVSGMYAHDQSRIAVVLPLGKHPTNNNGVLVYDLSVDPEPLLTLSAEEIHKRIFTAQVDLPEGSERVPLKTVHINKCPVLAPVSVLRPEDAERLSIDMENCCVNLEKIKMHGSLNKKLASVFSQRTFVDESDPDLMIYSGGFFSDADRLGIDRVRETPAEKLGDLKINFKDLRLPEMLFRYRARNFPEFLSTEEQHCWDQFCVSRLSDRDAGASIVLQDYYTKLENLTGQQGNHPECLAALKIYADGIKDRLSLSS